MWKKRAQTTWERGVVAKLISKTSSCIRPIDVYRAACTRGVAGGYKLHSISSIPSMLSSPSSVICSFSSFIFLFTYFSPMAIAVSWALQNLFHDGVSIYLYNGTTESNFPVSVMKARTLSIKDKASSFGGSSYRPIRVSKTYVPIAEKC